ncbi:MAG TPA: heme lyase CcmF/NrfE family subunit [Rhodocyclaceae bacterium]
MIPEIGNLALLLAMAVALVQGIVPIVGAARGQPGWMAAARPLALAQFLFVGLAFGVLTYVFVTNDFSVRYVAANSNTALPLPYRVAAVWGGHEGSILLWTTILASWTLAVAIFSKHLPRELRARVLGVMGLISVGLIAFVAFTSNPFERLLPPAMDGRDLNPQLQDPGMILHPPLLYMGYVGFSVAFAFAVSALMGGKLDAAWARWSRPWTTVAWIFLTLGIAIGSGWAYYTLGWGGWWFWDPVENASLMPWLVGTGLIHSLAVTEKRGSFKTWTVLLAIFAFSLSLMGTFLVRSGVLTSVHAFAADPRRGIFILGLLGIVWGGALALFAWRAPRVGLSGRFDLLSRETLLLANNVILSVAAAAVFLGTLYPLFLDALGLGKISVGPPYFETVFVPIMVPALLLMAVAPLVRWKQAAAGVLARRLIVPAILSLAAAIGALLAAGRWSTLACLGLFEAAWIVALIAVDLRDKIGPVRGAGQLRARLAMLSRSYCGMLLAHLGVAAFIVGVTVVKTYEVEKDVRMEVGNTVAVGGYVLTFGGVAELAGPNYAAARGTMKVAAGGRQVTEMHPEKRLYSVSRMPITEAAIDAGVLRDIYVSLGEPLANGAWAVRVYFKPFVDWIWGGCILMALGGFWAMSDRRYRVGQLDRDSRVAALLRSLAPAGAAEES